jgi:hypothetical protein
LKEEKIEIEGKSQKSRDDRKRLKEIELEMKPLEKFLDDAKLHRKEIKDVVGVFIKYFCCNLF